MLRFLFILQYDSFIRTLKPVASRLLSDGHACKVILYQKRYRKKWVDEHITSMLDGVPYEISPRRAVYREVERDYDVIVIGSVGGRFILRFVDRVKRSGLKSKVVTGYVGALLDNNETGFLNGVTRRSESDLIWVPGEDAVRKIMATGLIAEPSKLANTGLPHLDGLFELKDTWPRGDTDRILFIEQPTFPESKRERIRLVDSLCEVARAYGDKQLVIKPRFKNKVKHAHSPKHLLPDLLLTRPDRPDNISVSNESLPDQFPRTEFCITISSTGGLESLLAGIPTYFIDDFCADSNRYGSEYFRRTGGVTSLRRILAGELPELDFEAAQQLLRFDGLNTSRLAEAIVALAAG